MTGTPTISERALGIKATPEKEQDISEQFRLAAERWADLDAAAFMLVETKTTVLEQMKHQYVLKHGPMADNACERTVKATSLEWRQYLQEMGDARRKANLARAELDYLRMRERRIDREYWNQKTERGMGRSST